MRAAAAEEEEEEGPVSTWGKREKEKVDTARRGGGMLAWTEEDGKVRERERESMGFASL